MRKLRLLLLCLPISFLANGQAGQINQINIVSFTVKNTLPATVDAWMTTPGAMILVAQKVPNSVPLKEPRLILQIKSGGAIVCGNNLATAKQVDPFDVRTFNTAELTGLLANCKELKEGTYTICAQFYNIDRLPISREVCKEFRVEAPNVEYAPPTLITPESGKQFSLSQLQGPVTFRWTPLVPKPKEPVTYRLRVWQLMQGQNANAAMKTNTPLVSKDVENLTQATVNAILTGPCRPPYLCDFVWNVQALNRNGKPMGNNNGMSEAFAFTVSDDAINMRGPANQSPANGKSFTDGEAKGPITFRWTPVVPKPQEPVTYRIKVWQLMQGQNAADAIKTNPLQTKDVTDLNEAAISGIYTGPCRPPYLCDFIWNVQALDRSGHPVGNNEGTSEAWSFKITAGQGNCPVNTLPENNKHFSEAEARQPVLFKWTNTAVPGTPVKYRLKVWQLMQGQNGSQAMRTNKPIVTKDVADITEATVSGIYTGPCRPPYLCDFVWAVEMLDASGQVSCTSESSHWVLDPADPAGNISGPVNTFPEKNKKLPLTEVIKEVKFRWTAVTPKPQEPVTYKLKVWQLMQGQTAMAAVKNNKPIAERSVTDNTEASIGNIITGPCRPPYLCDFVWNVQAVNREGKPIGPNNGNSEPTMFFATQYIIQLDSIKVLCTNKPGTYSFSFTLTNVNPGTANLTNFAITSSIPAGATFGTYAPPIGTGISTGNQLTVTGTLNGATNLSYICIGAEITDAANTFWKASKDTCIKVEPCRCDACDEKNFVMNAPKPAQINWANNTLSFNQPLTITTSPPKTIKTIKAELVYFELIPQLADCLPCDKDSRLYGHFANGTNNQVWTGPQTNLAINITTPNAPCCSTLFRWCIRYKIEFTDCTVCSKTVCYEKKKEGCVVTHGDETGTSTPNQPK